MTLRCYFCLGDIGDLADTRRLVPSNPCPWPEGLIDGRAVICAGCLNTMGAPTLRSMAYEEYLLTPEWRDKRQAALDQAEFACQLCGSTDSLQVHHRTYERRGAERLADLTVLCAECHERFHKR